MTTMAVNMAMSGLQHVAAPWSGSDEDSPPPQRSFKRHKTLPHPTSLHGRSISGSVVDDRRKYLTSLRERDQETMRSVSDKFNNEKTLRRRPVPPQHSQRPRDTSGPDMPPTPPAHSRNSSGSHVISSLAAVGTEITRGRSVENVHTAAATTATNPATPTNQRSPPTPDVTPPKTASRLQAQRPVPTPRALSRVTADSRTDSFRTARENPESTDEENGPWSPQEKTYSVRTSQATVRSAEHGTNGVGPAHPSHVGLGLGLESSPGSSEARSTPTAKRSHRIDHASPAVDDNEVEQEWDHNLMRNVTVRKRRNLRYTNAPPDEEVVESSSTVTPTSATRALRHMYIPAGQALTYSPTGTVDSTYTYLPGQRRNVTAPAAASTTGSSSSADPRRYSNGSGTSTVVRASLVNGSPLRQQTLRRVNRLETLRGRSTNASPLSSAPTSSSTLAVQKHRQPHNAVISEAHHDRVASVTSTGSVSNRKARREIIKNGGIPVVVIPDRQSSQRSVSGDRSLRSTSSKRSKRTQSLTSDPLRQLADGQDSAAYFDRPSRRRERPVSTSDGSMPGDQRTIDYPPIVPRRTSSLSAPTSRNASRSGSVSGSLPGSKRHSLVKGDPQVQDARRDSDTPRQTALLPTLTFEPVPSSPALQPSHSLELRAELDESSKLHPVHKVSMDRNGDPFFGNRRSTQATPFSFASVETTATSAAAEISEAHAVSIAHHQNKSLRMLDFRHSEFDGDRPGQPTEKPISRISEASRSAQPTITTTYVDASAPVTPRQPIHQMDEIDSPLRNPRDPPEPPMLKLIPATPSGLTPAEEKAKQLGDFYDDEIEEKQRRGLSLVRRALGVGTRRRSNSEGEVGTYYTSTTSGGDGGSGGGSSGISTSRKEISKFLKRSLSGSSKRLHRETAENPDKEGQGRRPGTAPGADVYPTEDDKPADEGRLHPFWRPAHSEAEDSGEEDEDMEHSERRDAASKKYPPRAGRPPPMRRSLSGRLKRTFAILPLDDKDEEHEFDTSLRRRGKDAEPERRTVQRDRSGSLRVVRHEDSDTDESSAVGGGDGGGRREERPRQGRSRYPPAAGDRRPSTAPHDGEPQKESTIRRLIRSASLTRRRSRSVTRGEEIRHDAGGSTAAVPFNTAARGHFDDGAYADADAGNHYTYSASTDVDDYAPGPSSAAPGARNWFSSSTRKSNPTMTGHSSRPATSGVDGDSGRSNYNMTGTDTDNNKMKSSSSYYSSISSSSNSRAPRAPSSTFSIQDKYNIATLPRRLSEHRREKRSKELRAMIGAPMEVRDGVGDVLRR